MKTKWIIIFFAVLQCSLANSQQKHTLAPFVGKWKATSISLPTLFTYSKDAKKFTPLSFLQMQLQNDADGTAKKSVEELERSLPALLETIELEITDYKLYIFNQDNKKKQGYCEIFDQIQIVGPETKEPTFLDYVENYGYNGGFKLYDNSTKKTFFAHLKIANNDTTIVLEFGEAIVGLSPVKYIYSLKKVKEPFDPTAKTLFDKRIRSELLYAKDIKANSTIVNADTSHMISYALKGDHITFYFYTPGSDYQPSIYFDVNNNNKEDASLDLFFRNFRDKLQNMYVNRFPAKSRRDWDAGNDVVAITYPISEISQSNVIGFQVAYQNWEEGTHKEILVPSRKNEVDFKSKNMFYITIPQ